MGLEGWRLWDDLIRWYIRAEEIGKRVTHGAREAVEGDMIGFPFQRIRRCLHGRDRTRSLNASVTPADGRHL